MKAWHYLLIGGIAVLLAVAALIWSRQPQGLDLYQDLLTKQEYGRARMTITQELSKKPQRHEARTLLAEVELAAGQPLAALEQIIILWQAEWDTDHLEEGFLTVLPPGEEGAAIALLEGSPPSFRSAQLAVGIALKAGSPEFIARTLPALRELQPGNPLIAQAWTQLKTQDPVAAWQLADELDLTYKKRFLHELNSRSELAELLPKLLAIDPQTPELIISLARETGGREGWKLLMAMEEAGYTPGDDDNFAITKLDLLKLAAPEQVDSSSFAGIETSELYALAKAWVGFSLWDDDEYPIGTTAFLLDYLSKDNDFRGQALLLKAILQPPPEPAPSSILYFEKRRDQGQIDWVVSPCGLHALYYGWENEKTYWYSLDQDEHWGEFSQELRGVWDAENQLVALIPTQAPGKILIHSTQSAQELAQFAWTGALVLGWRDGCLLLAHAQGGGYEVEALDPVTGEGRTLMTAPALPSPSATGKLGYLHHTNGNLTIVLGKEEMTFSGSWSTSPWQLHNWLPRDRGVILAKEGKYAILYFADGIFLPMGLEEFELHPWGWLDQRRVVATVKNGGYTAVVIVDTRDMSWTHTGIQWAYNGEVSDTVISRFRNANMLVFRLK